MRFQRRKQDGSGRRFKPGNRIIIMNQEQVALDFGTSGVVTKAASRGKLIRALHALRIATAPAQTDVE
jgi:hypothetical protein